MMKPEIVTLIPRTDKCKHEDKDALVSFFEQCADQAKNGEITGVLALIIKPPDYEHTRIGFTYEAALGMCHRMAHLLLKDWDGKL